MSLGMRRMHSATEEKRRSIIGRFDLNAKESSSQSVSGQIHKLCKGQATSYVKENT